MEIWLGLFYQPDELGGINLVASRAEELGFTGIAVADHVALPSNYHSNHPSERSNLDCTSPYPDPVSAIASMSAVTTSLRFMTYAYILTMRDPFTAAKQIASLSNLAGSRFEFGTALGWMREEIELLGHSFQQRGRRFEEMISILQGFWRHGSFSHKGEFYDFAKTGIYPKPRREPRILVGGSSHKALKRAAKFDGWLAMNHSLPEIKKRLLILNKERKNHVRSNSTNISDYKTYVIPVEDLSRGLIEEFESLGVTGVVINPKFDKKDMSAKRLVSLMESISNKWILS